MTACADAIPEILLRPDDVAFHVHERGAGRPPDTVPVLRLQPHHESKWLVAWRKGRRVRVAASGRNAPAVNLVHYVDHRGGVVALVDPISQILLRPDDSAFLIDVGLGGRPAKAVAILGLERGPEGQWFISGWKGDRHGS